ncbi:hypothetical protein LIER_15648 [Lithospermum erythrorhizon]|uniref:Uncharacterized protein n=1 Tax=Lithospermum erythrorhizon TaxID=34254 RepID=A0AAV3Q6W6_LITER
MGTHVGGSKSHTQLSAQIVDSTGDLPSIPKRLKLQYEKKDSEGNPSNEMINLTSDKVLDCKGGYILFDRPLQRLYMSQKTEYLMTWHDSSTA